MRRGGLCVPVCGGRSLAFADASPVILMRFTLMRSLAAASLCSLRTQGSRCIAGKRLQTPTPPHRAQSSYVAGSSTLCARALGRPASRCIAGAFRPVLGCAEHAHGLAWTIAKCLSSLASAALVLTSFNMPAQHYAVWGTQGRRGPLKLSAPYACARGDLRYRNAIRSFVGVRGAPWVLLCKVGLAPIQGMDLHTGYAG